MSARLVQFPQTAFGVDECSDTGCAYILETDAAKRSCGLPRQPRSSYCFEHHTLCHLACGTSAEVLGLREVETLARAVGGRQGWRGAGPSLPYLERLTHVVRNFS